MAVYVADLLEPARPLTADTAGITADTTAVTADAVSLPAADFTAAAVNANVIFADLYEPVGELLTADSTLRTADATWPTADAVSLPGGRDVVDAEVIPVVG